MANSEKVYCGRCPIVEVCYGNTPKPDETQEAKDCVLARLYYGEIKVEVTGYIKRD